jgi:hypothetical protein
VSTSIAGNEISCTSHDQVECVRKYLQSTIAKYNSQERFDSHSITEIVKLFYVPDTNGRNEYFTLKPNKVQLLRHKQLNKGSLVEYITNPDSFIKNDYYIPCNEMNFDKLVCLSEKGYSIFKKSIDRIFLNRIINPSRYFTYDRDIQRDEEIEALSVFLRILNIGDGFMYSLYSYPILKRILIKGENDFEFELQTNPYTISYGKIEFVNNKIELRDVYQVIE